MHTASSTTSKKSRQSFLHATARYQLLDQRQQNMVKIYDTIADQYLIIPALEIANNRTMIREFYPEEACMIGVIAGQACLEPSIAGHLEQQ